MHGVSAESAPGLNAMRLLLVRTNAAACRHPLTDAEHERLDALLGDADRHLAAERREDASRALEEALSLLQVDTSAAGRTLGFTAAHA